MKPVSFKTWAALILSTLLTFACSRSSEPEAEVPFQEEKVEEEMPESKPATPVKITEEVYIEITARSALIFDKYKDDLDEAHRQVDILYQKFGITFIEYNQYRKSLSPGKKRQLEKQVQEYIQKVYKEYE